MVVVMVVVMMVLVALLRFELIDITHIYFVLILLKLSSCEISY